MPEIKLIALDLDGTLLNSRGKLSERNVAAIRAAEERGVLVTIATGRRFRDARPVGIEAELNAPLITHNGALTKFADSLETVDAKILRENEARKVLEVGKKACVDAMLSCDPHGKGLLLYESIREDNVQLQKYIAWSRRIHGDEAEQAVRHVESLDAVLSEVETVHISFSGTCLRMEDLKIEIESELGDEVKVMATVYTAQNFTLLDILNSDASKGHGLKAFAEIRQIPQASVMAMGDNFNDLEMLEYAGTGVVMGNASPELLEDGRFSSTLSNDEDGVAFAIEKFILS